MPLHVDDTVCRQMRFVEKLGATSLAEDTDLFAKIPMQVQSGGRRDEGENLSLLIE